MRQKIRKKLSFKKVSNNSINLKRLDANIFFHGGVLIERAHYHAILTEKGRTNRGGRSNRGSTVPIYGYILITL